MSVCKAKFAKLLAITMGILFVIGLFPMNVHAIDESKSYRFELMVDGQESKEVQTGDVITVSLYVVRTDADEPYIMHAMQDEIQYDSNFFELIPDGAILAEKVQAKDIGMRDDFREFYMNYLSLGGGEQWNSRVLVGSFQLKVIGTQGVTKITNSDYLVSLEDGSDSYKCEANELSIILSSECKVHFETNGGSDIEDVTAVYGEKLDLPTAPVKDGLYFAGWYKDIDLLEAWDFKNDTVQGNMTLYAKWSEEPVEDESAAGKGGFPWLWLMGIGGGILLIAAVVVFLLFGGKKKKKKGRH